MAWTPLLASHRLWRVGVRLKAFNSRPLFGVRGERFGAADVPRRQLGKEEGEPHEERGGKVWRGLSGDLRRS
jgi:hypothetical protein